MRRLAGTRKVGHAGTLDPMATGLLVVGLNRATRLLGHLTLSDKAYAATIRLGVATTTDDAEGGVSAAPGAPADLADARIEQALAPLRGDIWQAPSAVSAIKVAGVRSYARVRRGEEVALAARRVRVSRFDWIGRENLLVGATPVIDLEVEVECSSGTYIRALARDLGAALGTGGHLTRLRRTRVGPFRLAEAQSLEQAQVHLEVVPLGAVAARCFPTRTVSAADAGRIRHGRSLPGIALPGEATALLDEAGNLLALYRPAGEDAVPLAVFV